MGKVFAALVMVLGVILVGWNLYCLYHGLMPSIITFCTGAVCALLGSAWLHDRSREQFDR